jgi:hypothetical protein
MIHNHDFTKLSNTMFTKWAALVDQMPALSWDQKGVDPAKVTIRVAKLAASSLPRATPLRTTKT